MIHSMLQSDRFLNLDKNISQENVSIAGAVGYLPESVVPVLDMRGYSMISFRISAASASFSLQILGGESDRNLQPLTIWDEDGNAHTTIRSFSAVKRYYIDCRLINTARFYRNEVIPAGVTATFLIGLKNTFKEPSLKSAESSKIVEIGYWLTQTNTVNANVPVRLNLDVSAFRFIQLRARTRSMTENTYEGRNFILKGSWNFTMPATLPDNLGIHGGGRLQDFIQAFNSYDEMTGWMEMQSPSLNLYLTISDAANIGKYFEINLVGIR